MIFVSFSKIPIGSFAEDAVSWATQNFDVFFSVAEGFLSTTIGSIYLFLSLMPVFIFILLLVLLAGGLAGKKTAVFTGLGLLLIYNLGLWEKMMLTLSLVTASASIALVIGLPLGILMSKSGAADKFIRPVLDFMQTMPAYVYLIPALYFFDLGEVPGAVATIIFAMPPIVRLTNLGIRQVPADVVEAAKSFGATQTQLLSKVQLPLAVPTIMSGLNQTIMLSLSMVVISAMVGTDGLGRVVYEGITQMDIGKGFEGGLAVVILAIILDRVTQQLGTGRLKTVKSFLQNFLSNASEKEV